MASSTTVQAGTTTVSSTTNDTLDLLVLDFAGQLEYFISHRLFLSDLNGLFIGAARWMTAHHDNPPMKSPSTGKGSGGFWSGNTATSPRSQSSGQGTQNPSSPNADFQEETPQKSSDYF